MRMLLRAAAVCWLLAAPAIAHAHARLVASHPGDHALLSASPKSIDLWFQEILDDEFNGIAVLPERAPGGEAVDFAAGQATVDPYDRTHLSVPVKRLARGVYVVQWKVLSRDGHTARGRFSFRVIPDRDGAY